MSKFSYHTLKNSSSSFCSRARTKSSWLKQRLHHFINSSYHFFSENLPKVYLQLKVFMSRVNRALKEYLPLLLTKFRLFFYDSWEFICVALRYYFNFLFLKVDLSLLMAYAFQNPFRISKEFLLKKGEADVYVYGETPLTTLESIATQCEIKSEDTVFEMGCGRGRTCFWLTCFKKCRVIGIDHVPFFIREANRIKNKFSLSQIEFREEDMLSADLQGATVVYLYGTCLNEQEIIRFIGNCAKLPSGTKIITVSYPLNSYASFPQFEVMKRFTAKFTWGPADVYLQYRK